MSVSAFSERPGETTDLLTRLAGVQVARRRLEVRVPHGRLYLGDWDTGSREQRAVGVPEVVESQRAQPGGIARA